MPNVDLAKGLFDKILYEVNKLTLVDINAEKCE
jgi:hypothetical protein